MLAPRLSLILVLSGSVLSACAQAARQPASTFPQAVDDIVKRPEFKHASFGIEIYSLDSKKVLYEKNGQQLFTPGSTTKLFTVGTALHLLGPDYRFHTAVYRTGEVDGEGTLKGDLVLVASGDPNLSNRARPDGSLAFENEDHSYGGFDSRLVPGDPLAALRDIATQAYASGIRAVDGRVLIDTSLFPEGDHELGTGVVVSPISVNDNVIDCVLTPAGVQGAAPSLTVSPQVPYIKFKNMMKTGTAGSTLALRTSEATSADGILTVTLAGEIPLGRGSYISSYPVASPSRFAAVLLSQALREKEIKLPDDNKPAPFDLNLAKPFYTERFRVAEHVSAPMSETAKVILKVSQNLHASMTPFILGAVVCKATTDIDQKGFDLEREFLTKAGLDLSGASQGDGAGGSQAAFYTPDFVVRYLEYMSTQPEFAVFKRDLPILGRDGSLFNIQVDSPAAGHVFAKTGTFEVDDPLNRNMMLVGKGLAGYTTTRSGEQIAFALYLNHVSLPSDPDAITRVAGQALGEIAAAAYNLPITATP